MLSQEPAVVEFTMPRPIYLRWWFVLLSICGATLIIYLLFTRRLDQIKRKNQLELSVRSQQCVSLKAQMKPHFISNILNSIQSHSMLQDPIKVNQYITRLSRFVRNVLKMSDAKVVSLKDELEVIETYIELEQLRASKSFDYDMNIEKDINQKSFLILPMLIQPYIENAIEHGVSNVKDGLIQIDIKKSRDDSILITILDNGLGLQNSQSRKDPTSEHTSVGTDKNNIRLNLLKTIYQKTFVVNITDLASNDSTTRGTKVELSISNMSELGNNRDT